MELVEELKEVLVETAKELKGSICRLFMARTVRALGEGGQRLAEYQALNGLEEDALSTLYDAREVFFAS